MVATWHNKRREFTHRNVSHAFVVKLQFEHSGYRVRDSRHFLHNDA